MPRQSSPRFEPLEPRLLLAAVPAPSDAAAAASVAAASAPADWRFVVFGDSRNSSGGINTAILGELANRAVAEGAKFVLFTGDLADSGGRTNFQTWKNAMSPAYNVGIGVYPVMGNHDINAVGSFTSAFSYLPANGPAGETRRTYSFTYNNALFLALDTYAGGDGTVDQAWINQQLAARDPAATPHLFVFGHQPAFANNHPDTLDQDPAARNTFWNSIKNADGRTYFTGHDHFYAHARIADGDGNLNNDLHQFILGTAGAPAYTPRGYNGSNAPFTPVDIYHEADYGYELVDVIGNAVTMTWVHRTGANAYAPTADVFSYTVSAVSNAPPVAVDDAAATVLNTPVTINVLANDTDPDGDTLSLLSAANGRHGTVKANADGTVTYTPARNFSSADAFTYLVSDGRGGTADATVSVTVAPANLPPIAVKDAFRTVRDTPVTFNVLANDTDPDGDPLSIIAFTQPKHGTLIANGGGSFTYTPGQRFHRTAKFLYTISDAHDGAATAKVAIAVLRHA